MPTLVRTTQGTNEPLEFTSVTRRLRRDKGAKSAFLKAQETKHRAKRNLAWDKKNRTKKDLASSGRQKVHAYLKRSIAGAKGRARRAIKNAGKRRR